MNIQPQILGISGKFEKIISCQRLTTVEIHSKNTICYKVVKNLFCPFCTYWADTPAITTIVAKDASVIALIGNLELYIQRWWTFEHHNLPARTALARGTLGNDLRVLGEHILKHSGVDHASNGRYLFLSCKRLLKRREHTNFRCKGFFHGLCLLNIQKFTDIFYQNLPNVSILVEEKT